jgi:hypothetical protein
MDGSWTHNEFVSADLGDVRLNRRLAIILRRFAQSPLSPINHACDDWAETKAAYRFFSNDKIEYHEISKSHIAATKERCRQFPTVLAIQDTSYLNYSQHPQTKGLCPLSRKKGMHQKELVTLGLIMHSTFAVATDGLPLGIVDQKIYSRPQPAKKMTGKQRRSHNYLLPTEDKENYRWLESLENTSNNLAGIQSRVVTVCDREADMFDIFLLAQHLSMPLIVRANFNRTVNKKTTYSEKTGQKLWSLLKSKSREATITVQIPKKDKQEARTAVCEVRFTDFVLNQPFNYVEGKMKNPPNLNLYAIYVSETDCPDGSEAIDWVLLTTLPIQNRELALEIISWYCLRWRIETWHKVLKSGLQVEECRLSTSGRLTRYLAVMSIVAWRIFWLTLLGRVAPDASCRILLNDFEWRILAIKFAKTQQQKKQPPTLDQSIRWIAQLGGFLARKGDKQPGITHIWRGMKKFAAILEGASLVKDIYG